MSTLLIRPIAYRHVVFPDAPEGNGHAFNFSPELTCRGPAADEGELASDEQECVAWLFAQAGLSLGDYRPESIRRRMQACFRAARVQTAGELRKAVLANPPLLKTVLSTLIIGVTGFFRDPSLFAAVETRVLPDLLSRNQGPRVWSAGCSDGAELYSVAMLLAERGALQRATLLGTDCRPDAVARAREGRYDASLLKNVQPALRSRYFTQEHGGWRIHPYLRTVAQWRSGNVLTTPEPGTWDLVLCRNLSIYLQPWAAERLWWTLEQCLRPGGVLVVGKAERPTGARGLRPIATCIFRRDRS